MSKISVQKQDQHVLISYFLEFYKFMWKKSVKSNHFFLLFFLYFFFYWHVSLPELSNAKAIFMEEQQWYYLTNSWRDKGVRTFSEGIGPKVNVIAWLEVKLVY